ncbi:MAG: hypothetical protein GY856_15140 [bacterium]|nr:hypothetical protein [bacterium]
MLPAAAVQRRPGFEGPLCHWLPAYRQRTMARSSSGLGDARREARSLDLAGAEALLRG